MKKLLLFAILLTSLSVTTFAQKAKTKTKKVTTTSVSAPKQVEAAMPQMSSPSAPTTTGPAATFEKTEMDYGKIKQGSEPLRVFTFKNTGTEPLIISNAAGSCGCTVPTFPKEPIGPGQTSKIEVRYDTQRLGGFQKTVTLTTNEANPTRVLTIKGEVETPATPNPAVAPATEGEKKGL